MWRNFIRVTIRNITRNKAFSTINIAGLAIGLASAIFIILYIQNELGYDRFHKRSEDIYRLYMDAAMAGSELKGAWNAPIYGPVFHEEIPEIEAYCRMDFARNRLMWVSPENKYLENCIMYADSTFFEVFSIDLLEGDPATCLDEPFTILLSESRRDVYFPEGDPIGKSIAMNNDSTLFRVTGVVEDAPGNSHFTYDFICSYATDERSRSTFWFSNWMFTYFLVTPGTDQAFLDEKINSTMLEHIRPQLKQLMGITPEEFEASGNRYGLFTQALLDIHLDKEIALPNDIGYRPIGNSNYLLVFGVIAFFILVIASINFMNLSTARSMSRAKEVSLRKVVGSGRKQLIRQFLFESVFLSLASLFLALCLVNLLLQPFNNLLGLQLEQEHVIRWHMIIVFVLLAILVGLLSGSYPSFVLASFKPAYALKGRGAASNGTTWLRNVLVIIQFSISMVIIAGTLVIFWQFRYMTNKDLGFDKEQLVVVERTGPLGSRTTAFMEELEKHASVLSVSSSGTYLGTVHNNSAFGIKGRSAENSPMFSVYSVDEDFMETYRLQLATPESRFLSREFGSDSSACLINETAVRKYQLDDPLNQVLLAPSQEGFEKELRVIGVLKDHHFSSLKNEVGAQVMVLRDNPEGAYITLRLEQGQEHVQAGLAHLEEKWQEFAGEDPLQYFFLDDFILL
jgi:putative ABC transport system permease protein